MIIARINPESTTPAEAISYPFLWRSEQTARVYLRFKLDGKPFDIRLIANDTSWKIGEVTGPQLSEKESWRLKLTTEEVILKNEPA